MKLKIRLYAASVCSLLIYGAETWILHEAVQRKIRGANSLMLARITGRSFRDEARTTTTSYDLLSRIRVTRLRWLGHILREGEDRLMCQAVKGQRVIGKFGDLLMDAPPPSLLPLPPPTCCHG